MVKSLSYQHPVHESCQIKLHQYGFKPETCFIQVYGKDFTASMHDITEADLQELEKMIAEMRQTLKAKKDE